MPKKNTTKPSRFNSAAFRRLLAIDRQWWFSLLLVLVVTLYNFVRLAHRLSYNSDDIALQNIVASWQEHGFALTWAGIDNFIIKIPLYFLANNFIGNPVTRTDVVSGLLVVPTIVLFSFWVIRIFRPRQFWLTSLALLFLASNGMVLYLMHNPNVRNIEVAVGFWLVSATVLLSRRTLNRRNYLFLAVLLLVNGVFLYNDPLFLYMLFVPLGLFFFLEWLRPATDHRAARLGLIVVIGSIVVSKIATVILAKIGFVVYSGGPPTFVALNDLGSRLLIVINDYLTLFKANFFGRLMFQVGTVRALASALMAVLVAGLAGKNLVAYYRQEPSNHRDTIVAICSLGLITNLIVFLFTDATFAADTRYLILVPFFAIPVLLDYLLRLGPARNLRLCLLIVLAVVVAGNLLVKSPVPLDGTGRPDVTRTGLIEALTAHHYHKGYAPYWDSNVTSYFSDRKLDVTPIVCTPQAELGTYYWLLSAGDLRATANQSFLVYDSQDSVYQGCSLAAIKHQFGQPVRTTPVNGSSSESVLLFNYDIRTKFTRTIPIAIEKYGS